MSSHRQYPAPPREKIVRCDADPWCESRPCAQCLEEIPPGTALSATMQDYVYHFCGQPCLERWRARAHAHREPGADD